MRKGILRLLLLVSLIGIVYALYYIVGYFNEYKQAEKKYEELQQIHERTATDLKDINEDYVGWLSVDGTNINYPVVLGEDNEFYLTHNFYKEDARVGAIFMDYRNSVDELEPHTIIYGHNMKDKSMFASLANILEADFAKENRIHLELPSGSFEWEIFSSYVTRATDWMQIDFSSEADFGQFTASLEDLSARPFPTEEKVDDKLITLATCTNDITDERIVVHGKLIKGEE